MFRIVLIYSAASSPDWLLQQHGRGARSMSWERCDSWTPHYHRWPLHREMAIRFKLVGFMPRKINAVRHWLQSLKRNWLMDKYKSRNQSRQKVYQKSLRTCVVQIFRSRHTLIWILSALHLKEKIIVWINQNIILLLQGMTIGLIDCSNEL